jgi:acetolactate synthase-1/3 small subunit
VTDTTYTIELTGDVQKLDAFIDTLNEADILETVRSGVTGISRGAKALTI